MVVMSVAVLLGNFFVFVMMPRSLVILAEAQILSDSKITSNTHTHTRTNNTQIHVHVHTSTHKCMYTHT